MPVFVRTKGRAMLMTEVRDACGHLVCVVEESSGYVEAVYKKQTISTYLPVGKSLRIERQGAVTTVIRDTEATFKVERHTAA